MSPWRRGGRATGSSQNRYRSNSVCRESTRRCLDQDIPARPWNRGSALHHWCLYPRSNSRGERGSGSMIYLIIGVDHKPNIDVVAVGFLDASRRPGRERDGGGASGDRGERVGRVDAGRDARGCQILPLFPPTQNEPWGSRSNVVAELKADARVNWIALLATVELPATPVTTPVLAL